MKNTKRLPEYILDDIKRNVPMGSTPFTDEEINNKSNYDLLRHWLNWNGLIGYENTIINVIEQIYNVKLEEK